MEVKIVGSIHLKSRTPPVCGNLDEPLLRATDVAELPNYGDNNVWNLTNVCEDDEKPMFPAIMGRQRRRVTFVTETGLYNTLTQSRKPIAQAWRRVIVKELIVLWRSRRKNISEQLKDWGHRADTIYFDEENDMLMRSVTVPGGDVEQVPYEP